MKFMTILITLASFYSTYTRKVNWLQLKNILASGNLSDLSRSAESQRLYSQLKDKLKIENMTMPNFVKQKIFGFKGHPRDPMHMIKMVMIDGKMIPVYVTGTQRIWNEFIKRTIYCAPVPGIKEGSDFVLFAINNFPYDLNLINHWVIWSSCQLKQHSIKSLLGEVIEDNIDTLTFENPPESKSIPEINHFQLFWKKKSDIMNEL